MAETLEIVDEDGRFGAGLRHRSHVRRTLNDRGDGDAHDWMIVDRQNTDLLPWFIAAAFPNGE